MAKKVRCKNGHWYDQEKYSECPHCKAGAQDQIAQESNKEDVIVLSEKKKKSIWPWKHANKQNPTVTEAEEIAKMEFYTENSTSQEEDVFAENDQDNRDFIDEIKKANAYSDEEQMFHSDIEANDKKSALTPDQEKTVAYYGIGEEEPVVGWLICVKGVYFGQDFAIRSGMNFVGRSVSMDICIMNDLTVSREKHTVITYDPRGKVYGIQPGESSQLTYLNGEAVYERHTLKSHDKLEIGNGVYVFIPLCDGEFSWDDYTEEA